jgi:acyl-coenzyme A synthetase/AMP-(fatty) acid ligase
MFGLELAVMLPLVHGLAVAEARPLLPADVSAALMRCPTGALWVTTPVHLRALVASGEALRGCRAIITSTMPLDPELAASAEDLAKAPVIEIYGSTETGALATRRTSRSTLWEPLEGVRIDVNERGSFAAGEHFPSPQQLTDQIETGGDGYFRLIGRDSDLVKVAGKRISLAGLELLLHKLPGLREGVFHQPRGAHGTDRLVLIFEGPRPDTRAALAWLRQHMDPVFLPRAFIQTEKLPRTPSGKVARHALDSVYAQWREKNTRQS